MNFTNYMVKLPAPISPASIHSASENGMQIYSNDKTVKIEGDITKIEMTDLSGSIVYRTEHPNYMNLNFLPSGIYVVQASTGNGDTIINKIAINKIKN